MNLKPRLLLVLPTATIVATLAFASPAFAWHITSSCSNSQWVVGIPNESWANGTVATLDFNQGPDATLGKGQATTAPAAATSVAVSFNNSGERLTGSRPEGCVVAVQAIPTTTTTTVAPTTTTVDPTTTTMSSVAVATLETPAPAALLAVDIPPVPQPQGVLSASGGQTLPQTGGGSNLLLAGGIAVAAGAAAMLVARRRTA